MATDRLSMVKPQHCVRQLEVSPAPCDCLGVLHSDPPAQEQAITIQTTLSASLCSRGARSLPALNRPSFEFLLGPSNLIALPFFLAHPLLTPPHLLGPPLCTPPPPFLTLTHAPFLLFPFLFLPHCPRRGFTCQITLQLRTPR